MLPAHIFEWLFRNFPVARRIEPLSACTCWLRSCFLLPGENQRKLLTHFRLDCGGLKCKKFASLVAFFLQTGNAINSTEFLFRENSYFRI